MKLEHTTTPEGDFFEITDARGQTVWLSPEEALLVADWINQRRGEIYAILHPETSNPTEWNPNGEQGVYRYNPKNGDDLEI